MVNSGLTNFLESKRKYEKEGWNFIYIFELFYLKEMKEKYAKKLIKLEEHMENFSDYDAKKMGSFLMSAFSQKNFSEDLLGLKFIHVATEEGFSKQEYGFIGMKQTGEANPLKRKHFIEVFTNMVSDNKMIPDQSCILLNNEYHHLRAATSPKSKSNDSVDRGKMIKREKLSQVCFIMNLNVS